MTDKDREAKITHLYGERCLDYDPDCPACVVWELLDAIKAARTAALEEAARVAEDHDIDWAAPSGEMPDKIAAAIRALIGEE